MKLIAVLASSALMCASTIHAISTSATGTAHPTVRVQQPRPYQGFVENRGQWADDVLFFAREGRVEVTVFSSGFTLRPVAELPNEADLRRGIAPATQLPPVFMTFEHCGVDAAARVIEGLNALPTRHNFLRGVRSASGARGFAAVIYHDVAPGIDVQLRTADGHFEYDVLARPGADLEGFSIAIAGADDVAGREAGVLSLRAPAGDIEQRIGASWQTDAATARQTPMGAEFVPLPPNGLVHRYGFNAPGWTRQVPMVIDPSLIFATYIGGGGQELLESLAVDAAGASYPACWGGAGTPTTPGGAQNVPVGGVDAWIGKLSADGTALDWGTYLGGIASEADVRVAVDKDGSVVVTGSTWSSDFPTTPGALQQAFAGTDTKSDVFISRLAADGGSLVWSTLFGGTDYEHASAITLTPSGEVVVAGNTKSLDVSATPGAFDPTYDSGDQLVLKLKSNGSALEFLTYFKTTRILDIATDLSGNVYFCGNVLSPDAPIPTTPGAFKPTFPPGVKGEGYVAKLDALGQYLLWATYLGGNSNSDTLWGIALDSARAVYVCGQTFANDFPVTAGAFDVSLGGSTDGVVAKLLPDGSGLVWSTYVGSANVQDGSGYATDIAVDAAGNAVIVGAPNASGWPITPDAIQPAFVGPAPSADVVVTKLDAVGEALVHSTYFAGNGGDYRAQVGVGANGAPRLACVSFADDLPTLGTVYDPSFNGGGDIAAAALDLPMLPWRVLSGGLKGTFDTPNLAGVGALVPGSTTRFVVRGAASSSFGWFVVGASQVWIPLLSGTLVPSPDVYFLKTTSALGSMNFSLAWPDLPAGTELTFQAWILDPGAPDHWSSTNAIEAIAQM